MKLFSKIEALGDDYLEVEARPLHLLNQSYKSRRNEGSRMSYQQQHIIKKEGFCQSCADLQKKIQSQNEQIQQMYEELRVKKEPFQTKTPEKINENAMTSLQEELRHLKIEYLRLKKSAEETQEQLEEAWFQESELKQIIQDIQEEFKIQREKEELEWKQKIQEIEDESRELMDKADISIQQAEIQKEEVETELEVQAAEWEAERNCFQIESLQAKETILQLKRQIQTMNQQNNYTKGLNQSRYLVIESEGEDDIKYGYDVERRQQKFDQQDNELKESLDLQDQIIQELAQQQRKVNNISKDKKRKSSVRRKNSIYEERTKDEDQYYFNGQNSSLRQKQIPRQQRQQQQISSLNNSSNKLNIEETIQRLENEVISIQNSLSAEYNPRLHTQQSNKRNNNISQQSINTQSFEENYQGSMDYDNNYKQKLNPTALNALRNSLNEHSCAVCSTNKMCERASRMKELLKRYEHLTKKSSNGH